MKDKYKLAEAINNSLNNPPNVLDIDPSNYKKDKVISDYEKLVMSEF